MNSLLKLHNFHHFHPPFLSPHYPSFKPTKLWVPLPQIHKPNSSFSLYCLHKPINITPFLSNNQQQYEEEVEVVSSFMEEELGPHSQIYNNTLRLVECSMFASISALSYLLSNSLAIESYFGCFFALPIVITSVRWGVAAGRKSMVASAILLLVLSGPVKALTYVLMHGLLGFTMGSLWRLQVKWSLSIFLCTLVRAVGALGYVLISSFLIRENILALINVNLHAVLTMVFNSVGFNIVPSMSTIYAIFGFVLLLNNCFFAFLLHILYALFLTRLGMKGSLVLPRWLNNAL